MKNKIISQFSNILPFASHFYNCEHFNTFDSVWKLGWFIKHVLTATWSNSSKTSRTSSSDFKTRDELTIRDDAEDFLGTFQVFWNRRNSSLQVFELTSQILKFLRKNRGECWPNLCNLFLRFQVPFDGMDFFCLGIMNY